MIVSINKCRKNVIHNLVTTLHETRGTFLDGTRGCCLECRSFMYKTLTIQIQSSNLFSPKPKAPFLSLNHNDLVQTVLAFKSPLWYGSTTDYSSYRSSGFHDCPNTSLASVFAILRASPGLGSSRFHGAIMGERFQWWHLHA